MSKKTPTLYLLPNLLGKHRFHEPWLPKGVDRAMEEIDGLISESPQGGRSFLARFRTKKPPYEVPLAILNEHSKEEDINFLLEPVLNGECWGLVSDAGLPCIADPGARLVFRARKKGVQIKVFVGPSSLMLALMLTGLPGQQFAFHGYLPKDPVKRKRKILSLESTSKKAVATQLFIEAPYRSKAALMSLLESLHDTTLLGVAWDLTMPSQGIICQSVGIWKKNSLPKIDKKPTVFLFYANGRDWC